MNFPWNQSLTDILWLPVAQRLMMLQSLLVAQSYCEVFGILLTQFFTLGAASSFIRWKYCVIVHVSIIVVQLPHKHCGAINWSLLRACRCSEIVSGTFTHAEKRRNHNRRGNWLFFFDQKWCESWRSPIVSVVSICLLWMNLWWVCLPIAVLCWRIWYESSDLNWCCHAANIQTDPTCAWCVTHCRTSVFVSLFYYIFVILEDVRMLNYRAFGCT